MLISRSIFRRIVECVSLISILVTVVSCDKNDEKGKNGEATVYAENCIPYYVEPNSLIFNESRNAGSEAAFSLLFKGIQIDPKTDKGRYELLSKKYGDLGFDNYRALESDGALSVAIDSISVVSDVDIDESHPRGTDLSDIIKLKTRSFYRYIKSGYREYQDQYSDKDKLISEYTKEDFTLLFYNKGLEFHFDSSYMVKGIHNLTIIIFFEDGKKISILQSLKFN